MVEWCVESGAPPGSVPGERIAAHERMRPAAPLLYMYMSSPQTSSECMQQPLISLSPLRLCLHSPGVHERRRRAALGRCLPERIAGDALTRACP